MWLNVFIVFAATSNTGGRKPVSLKMSYPLKIIKSIGTNIGFADKSAEFIAVALLNGGEFIG